MLGSNGGHFDAGRSKSELTCQRGCGGALEERPRRMEEKGGAGQMANFDPGVLWERYTIGAMGIHSEITIEGLILKVWLVLDDFVLQVLR